jgi:glycosyltransferase involved in cell wall biosynthesis
MTLSFLPAGGARVASSRIRVFCLLGALHRRNVRTVLGPDPAADVLIVQKRVTLEIIAAVAAARKNGALIIYDCDDLGPALDRWAPPKWRWRMIRSADLVTTNTPEARAELLGRHRARAVAVIPDAIDYFPAAPPAPSVSTRTQLRVLWFGHRRNLPLLQPYAEALKSIPRCRLIVCTNAPPSRRDRAAGPTPWREADEDRFRHPSISFVPWEPESFPALLRSCDLSILPHDGTPADRAKSANRMIASIAWGTPAIASRTPAYARTARRMGVPECLFDGPEDLPALIDSLRQPTSRRRYLRRAQPWVWRHHSADVVAGRLCRTIARYRRTAAKRGPVRSERAP